MITISKVGKLTGIVVSMPEEAEVVIKALSLQKKEDGKYFGKITDDCTVILFVCGVGKVNAQNATWALVSLGADRIINIGTCGAAGEGHNVGECYYPNVFFDGDFDLSMFGKSTKDPANVNYKYIATADSRMPLMREDCYTYSTFISDGRCSGSLIDMEAYAIASVCEVTNVPFLCLKVVSDGADSKAIEGFDQKVSPVLAANVDQIDRAVREFDEVYSIVYKRDE